MKNDIFGGLELKSGRIGTMVTGGVQLDWCCYKE